MTATDVRRGGTRVNVLLATALAAAGGCGLIPLPADPPPDWIVVRGERSAAPPAERMDRVLLLPFGLRDALPEHAAALRRALAQALRERCGFEVLAPEEGELPRSIRDEVRGAGARSVDTLIRLHREWGADGVVCGEVAFSRPHGAPAVGLAVELLDARDGRSLWSAQDVVDARQPATCASLLEWSRGESPDLPDEHTDPAQVPWDCFARFVAGSYVRTLYPAPPSPGKTRS